MTLERIIVGSDFSETSSTALRYAADVATRTGLRMRVVHAYVRPSDYYFPSDMPFVMSQAQEQDLRKSCEKSLVEQLRAVGCDPADVDIDVGPGVAHLALLEGHTAKDLVVMGHDHRKALTRAFAGSVATRVVRRAQGPVLALPPSAGPGTPRRILLCDDFSDQAARIPETLASLSLLDGAEVEVVYVIEDPLEPLFLGANTVEEETEARRQALTRGFRDMLIERVKAYPQYNEATWEVTILRSSRAVTALLEHSASTSAELVAMASTGKGAVERVLLGSVAEGLLHKTDVPLLITH